MKVTCNVNQKAAVLAGRDPTSGQVAIEVNPAELDEQERMVLAALLEKGSDLTRQGISAKYYGINGPTGEVQTYVGALDDRHVRLVDPSIDGLKAELKRLWAMHEAATAALIKEEEGCRTKAVERLTAFRAALPGKGMMRVQIDDGKVVETPEWQISSKRKFEYQCIEDRIDTSYMTDAEKQEVEQLIAARRAANQAAKEQAIAIHGPELLREDEAEAEARRLAKEKAEAEAAAALAKEWTIEIQGNRRRIYEWEIEDGCVEIPETGSGGGWLAIVVSDKREKSGFKRTFFDRAAVGFGMVPGVLVAGDYVENGVKNKKGQNTYSYYRVLEVSSKRVVVRIANKPGATPPDVGPEIEAAGLRADVAATSENPLTKYSIEELEAELASRRLTP